MSLLEDKNSLDRFFRETLKTQRAFLVHVAHRVASQVKTDYDHFSGNYMYDVEEVREILDKGLLSEEPEGQFNPAESDLLEGLTNLFKKNSNAHAEIVNRYRYFIMPDQLDSAGKMRLSRAVVQLTELMNRSGAERVRTYKLGNGGPGSRKAMSNHDAEKITRLDSEGSNPDYER